MICFFCGKFLETEKRNKILFIGIKDLKINICDDCFKNICDFFGEENSEKEIKKKWIVKIDKREKEIFVEEKNKPKLSILHLFRTKIPLDFLEKVALKKEIKNAKCE